MAFSFCGQDQILDFLRKQLRPNDRLVQSFLFFGEKRLGKMTLAKMFGQSILCEKHEFPACNKCDNCHSYLNNIHPDILILEIQEDKNSLTINQARSAIDFLSYKPQIGNCRVLIIDEAENLTDEAQNALLKILEESPKDSLVILTSSQVQRLLSTVLSRVFPIRFSRVTKKGLADWLVSYKKIKADEAENLANISQGIPGLAILMHEDKKYLKELVKARDNLSNVLKGEFGQKAKIIEELSKEPDNLKFNLSQWLEYIRNQLLFELGLNELTIFPKKDENMSVSLNGKVKLLKELQKASFLLEDLNLNKRLLLENIFIK